VEATGFADAPDATSERGFGGAASGLVHVARRGTGDISQRSLGGSCSRFVPCGRRFDFKRSVLPDRPATVSEEVVVVYLRNAAIIGCALLRTLKDLAAALRPSIL